MMKRNDDDVWKSEKKLIRDLVTMFVLPYVVINVIVAWIFASLWPKAFFTVLVILGIIFIAALLGLLRLRGKFMHFMVARRADKQNGA